MDRQRRMQNQQRLIAVALALVLAVGMWGGLAVTPQRVAAAGTSPAAGGGCSTASFMEAAGSPFGAGIHPESVAVGDFNGDGKSDLAVAGDNIVTIRLGDGTGAFPDAKSSTVGAGHDAVSVAVGDFNGDGKLDLAVANFLSANVMILLGDGLGSFSQPAGSPVGAGTGPRSVAVGDFNGDGKPDLAVANQGDDNVTILLGDGKGSFSQAAGSPVGAGTSPRSVAVGDFNGDGKPDLAVANAVSGDVTIRLGDGTGAFPDANRSKILAGTFPQSVAVGDFNGDGKLDLAVANDGGFASDGNVTIRLGDGSGSFPDAKSSTVGAGTRPHSVAVGDFNGDGKPDFAVANFGDNTVTIRLGDGTGAFPTSSTVGAGTFPQSVAVGDFNGDGKPDLAVANEGDRSHVGNVTVQLNTCDASPCGGISFAPPTGSPFGAGLSPQSVAVGDFNRDGKPDLAIANSGDVTIRLGDGAGGFPTSSTVGAGTGPFSVAVGDFNGDGKPDLAVANIISGDVTIRLGDGKGGFPTSSTVVAGIEPQSVAVGDFNGDGKPDLAVANSGSKNVTILLGDGKGGFPTGATVGTGTTPVSVAVGDFNSDGKPDLAVANYGSANVTIHLGDGAGGFPTGTVVDTGAAPEFVAVEDFNGDGKLDLALANVGSGSVTIRLGDGKGGFPDAKSTTVDAGGAPQSVAVGDFNRDGKPDLAVANVDDNNVTIFLGDGMGGFPTSALVGAGLDPISVAVGDFNGDGKPDLAIANDGDNNVTVQLNTCTANHPPVANAGPDQTVECAGTTTPVTLDGSASSDPDGDALTYAWSENGSQIATGVNPTVNLANGLHTLTLTVTDTSQASTQDSLTVKVVDTTPPTLTLNPGLQFWPPDHMYRTVSMSQMVASVSDGCSSSLGLNDVVIEKVTSDEPDNAPGDADGNTTKDIVIAADCKSVQLRAERDSTKNGRFYVVTLRVRDSSGNTTRQDFKVSVPIGISVPAVQGSAAQTKTSSCSN